MNRKKLIEVALPLEAINAEAAREKSIRHGHPSTLHLWWARRPLAACRAVLFASLVDDPSSHPEKFPTPEAEEAERRRLFGIIERLVKWENIGDEKLYREAWEEILASTNGNPPPVLDPFAGGGSIPLEAQRLGLEAHASDLNPVAVLINKALIEIPPRFANRPPVNPKSRKEYLGERKEREDESRMVCSNSGKEYLEVRKEDDLQGNNTLAESHANSLGSLPAGSAAAERRNLRDKIADHKSRSVDSIEYCGGLGPGIPKRKSAVSVDSARVVSGSGYAADALRGPGMVPQNANNTDTRADGRSEQNANKLEEKNASGEKVVKSIEEEKSLKEREKSSEEEKSAEERENTANDKLFSHFSSLFPGSKGLAEDVKYYGEWMRKRAFERIGHLYPKVVVTLEQEKSAEERVKTTEEEKSSEKRDNNKLFSHSSKLFPNSPLTVIAWLWARTVKCPNPACGAEMPLVRSFEISKKKDNEAWVDVVIGKSSEQEKSAEEREKTSNNKLFSHSSKLVPNSPLYTFEVRHGKGDVPAGTVNRNGARCVCCGTPVPLQYVRDEGKQGRMGAKLMAIVAEGSGGRVYLSPDEAHIMAADVQRPKDYPVGDIPEKALGFRVQLYGMTKYADLFTNRQLTALTTFSDLVGEAIKEIEKEGKRLEEEKSLEEREKTTNDKLFSHSSSLVPLSEGGSGARAYAEAVGVYLAMLIDKLADLGNSLNRWEPNAQCPRQLFARQAIPMVWDFAEGNPLGDSSGSWKILLDNLLRSLRSPLFAFRRQTKGYVLQCDASDITPQEPIVISTDPPYYDNIGYADLSDFFYIWLRRSLQNVYPKLFSTLLVPKTEELVATPYRFDGDKNKAKQFFESGMLQTFKCMRETVSEDYPLTVYYAYKQTEDNENEESTQSVDSSSSGWETMLQALIKAGFSITGTWPLRTEMMSRAVAMNSNALASSIAIVCRPRPDDAPSCARRTFQTELHTALEKGLSDLQSGNIAPVDLAQASIGPGIAVYSQYKEVIEANGDPVTVRHALVMINHELDVLLGEQSGSLDGESQFCVAWFEQYGFQDGPYGDANTLLRARMASEQKLRDAGLLEAKQGKVRLKRRNELGKNEEREKSVNDKLFSHSSSFFSITWAIVQRLCRALDVSGGLDHCAVLMTKLSPDATERVKTLAYRIYQICDRKGWTDEALAYNNLVATWGILEGKTKEQREKAPPKPGELEF